MSKRRMYAVDYRLFNSDIGEWYGYTEYVNAASKSQAVIESVNSFDREFILLGVRRVSDE